MNLQEAFNVEDDNDSSTEALSEEEPNESGSITRDAEPLPGCGQREEQSGIAESLSGQAYTNEVFRQCHEAGREIAVYGGGCITTYPVSEIVLLRFIDIVDEDDNEIFEGPYTVVEHDGRSGRRRVKENIVISSTNIWKTVNRMQLFSWI